MLTLKEKIDINLTHSNPAGTWHGTGQTKLRCSNGMTWERVFISIDGLSDLTRVDFYKLPRDVTSAYLQEYVDNYGQYSNYHLDWTNRDNITTSNCLTPNSQSNSLLTLANQFKDVYFGGVTQTAATLFSYLENMYGNANGFFYVRTGGGNLYATQRIGTVDTCVTEYGSAPNVVMTWNPSDVITWGNEYGLPSTVDSADAIAAALIFGAVIQPNKLKFDVYVNGTRDPNVTIKWSAVERDDAFSLQTVNPNVWGHPHALIEGVFTPIISVGDINVPNDSQWYVLRHSYTWAGGYSSPYLTEFNTIVDLSGYGTLDKVVAYGVDSIANSMHYYLRFNKQISVNNAGVMTWGELFDVQIPRSVTALSDITVTQISNSSNLPEFETVVAVHLGAPPDETPDDNDDYPDGQDYDGNDAGVYDPTKPIPDFASDESTGFSGNAVLTRTYTMPADTLENVGSKLWSQSYFDVLKVQSNPIENVVGVKWFPFSIGGALTNIKVGDIDFEIQGHLTDSIYKFTIGSVKYTPATSKASYLDCSPYTTLKLHLPYCGIVQLDASECLNRTIWVDYVVDLVTGDCMALIYLDRTSDNLGIPYMNVSGHCGVDIPLTATNRVQTEMRAASQTISAVVGAAAHVVSGDIVGAATGAGNAALSIGGMDYTSQRTSSHSPACTSKANRACYLEISRPARDADSAGFEKRHGYPCNKYKTLSSLSGFIKCDARTRIDFAVTSRENEMIEQLLTTGVYV